MRGNAFRDIFCGTLIFQQSGMICYCTVRHVEGHTLALQHGGQNYSLLISCQTFDSYAQMCCKHYHMIFSTFSLKFKCKISVQKQVIHNFKNHILVRWPFTNFFIYQLFWTQACPEGMCTNEPQVPCEVPSLPNPTTRKGWPHHQGLQPLLFSNSDVGSFTFHKNKSVKVLWDGTYGFLSLSKKTRKSNHLQMSLQR